MKKSVVAGVAGAVRVATLTLAELDKQEKHGKRVDTTSQARRITETPPVTTTGLDLCALYAAHIEGAFIPKATTKVMHVLIQFPRNLIDHDDAEGLLRHAREFGKRVWGEDAIFADRYDRDEKSKGVVDLFVTPKYMKTTKLDRVGRLAVSMTNHNKALAKKYGRKPTSVWDIGRSLQDELHAYLRDVMRLEGVKRGSPKVYAGDDWKSAEQLRIEELEEENRRLQEKAAELEAQAKELDDREAAASSWETQLEADKATVKKNWVSVAIEKAQAKLLFRASDDDEGLYLKILETGQPKMNEAAMDESERMAYRSSWSERMLELARFVARALQVMRDKVAAAVEREKSAEVREAAARIAQDLAQQRLDAASAAEGRVTEAKVVAESFMAAWQRIPEDQRSPPVREAIIKAGALLAAEGRPAANPESTGGSRTRADAMAALAGMAKGPNAARASQLGLPSRSSGRGGTER